MNVEIGSLAERLGMVDNAPEEKIIEPIPGVQNPITTAPTNGTLDMRMRYIGFIKEGQGKAAFIRIDGVQRIVRENAIAQSGQDGYDDLTIKAIYPKFIVVSDGDTEEKIVLAKRTGQAISMVNGNEIDSASAPTESNERPDGMPQSIIDRRREKLEDAARSRTEGNAINTIPSNTRRGNLNNRRNRNRNNDD